MTDVLDGLVQSANKFLPAYAQVQVPCAERPFGFHAWSVFSHVCQRVLAWDPNEFRFVQGELPQSTVTPMALTIVAYYVVILGGRELMRDRPAFKLSALFQLHNVLLSGFSALLLALFFEQILPVVYRHGIYYAVCNEAAWTQPLVTLYYLNYMTKYVELLDTVFLVLKKKPLTFLHTYHHGATAALCYSQLVGHTSVSWVVISINLAVHVVMYWYYFLSARGIRVWWKEWVTRFQIIQFLVDIVFVFTCSYTHFAYKYTDLPTVGDCHGEEYAAIYGCGILSSYLFLFVALYIKLYSGRKAAAASKKAAAKANGKLPAKANGKANGKAKTTATPTYTTPRTRSQKA
ncbi:elongation of fatty acids protein-like protein [Dipodascopsis tothii]|uniref:elongation of fatty acids protein-like protein n=1 Tax=Dipodascopsis tothii TaxID=44089 RepID=UPI0034CDCD5A